MGRTRRRSPRSSLAAAAACLACAGLAAPAAAGDRFTRLHGVDDAATPARLDRVGVLRIGPARARNVLVLVPGTSASAAYFAPLARLVTARARGWQVWAVERRENLLEDHSMADRAKRGRITPRQLFDYYLGHLSDPSITRHYVAVPDADVPFARGWGMGVAVGDLRRVVALAGRRGGKVVLGGHSLGGTITTAYATWDFGGRAGARGLDGLVYVDGGSGTTPVTPEQAAQSLAELQSGSPWLAFGGISAPFAGLFNIVGSSLARMAPDEPAILQTWPLLPANLKPPVRATSEAGYGYALDAETSPPALRAAQVNAGRLAAAGDPRPWDRAGEISPIQRVARMFSGWGLRGLDGTAWYHPRRLTIDGGAVAAGNANPAQAVLGVRATHGADLGRRMRIYAFGAALGGARVLDAARLLARQSGIPERRLTLVDRQATYTHNDPAAAYPRNEFVDHLLPFLRRVARGR
jgi:hypothetical protein